MTVRIVFFTKAQAPRKVLGAPWHQRPEKVAVPRVPRTCPEPFFLTNRGAPKLPRISCVVPRKCAPPVNGAHSRDTGAGGSSCP